MLDLPRGPLVLAHSDRLDEVSHGAADGSVRERSLAELREVAPELPTLEEALAFFVDESPDVGLHVDLKLTTRLDELAAALRRFGLEERTVVSSSHVPSLRTVARDAPAVRIGFTYPEDRYGVSRRPALEPVLRAGLAALRAAAPPRPPAADRTRRSNRPDAPARARDAALGRPGARRSGRPSWHGRSTTRPTSSASSRQGSRA